MAGLGYDIDSKLYDEFSKLAEENGWTKYRVLEGAIRAFLILPFSAQAALMLNNTNAREIITQALLKDDYDKVLGQFSPVQLRQILAIMQESKEKTSPRKKTH